MMIPLCKATEVSSQLYTVKFIFKSQGITWSGIYLFCAKNGLRLFAFLFLS